VHKLCSAKIVLQNGSTAARGRKRIQTVRFDPQIAPIAADLFYPRKSA
jgi:hypothetical protein